MKCAPSDEIDVSEPIVEEAVLADTAEDALDKEASVKQETAAPKSDDHTRNA